MLGIAASSVAQAAGPVLVWGDSLSAAYGLPVDQGWVALLRARLGEDGPAVVNGSISGETTQGGLTRFPAALAKHAPSLVIIELGANDGLRGQSVAVMQTNLSKMVEMAQALDAEVVLLGMQMPPNYGRSYTNAFADAFKQVAARYDVPLVPFFLEGVATDFSLIQADGLHPTAEAQQMLLDNVWPTLAPLLEK